MPTATATASATQQSLTNISAANAAASAPRVSRPPPPIALEALLPDEDDMAMQCTEYGHQQHDEMHAPSNYSGNNGSYGQQHRHRHPNPYHYQQGHSGYYPPQHTADRGVDAQDGEDESGSGHYTTSTNNNNNSNTNGTMMRRLNFEKFRTRMCHYFLMGKECPFRDRCAFAHGDEQINTPMPQAALDRIAYNNSTNNYSHDDAHHHSNNGAAYSSASHHHHHHRYNSSTAFGNHFNNNNGLMMPRPPPPAVFGQQPNHDGVATATAYPSFHASHSTNSSQQQQQPCAVVEEGSASAAEAPSQHQHQQQQPPIFLSTTSRNMMFAHHSTHIQHVFQSSHTTQRSSGATSPMPLNMSSGNIHTTTATAASNAGTPTPTQSQTLVNKDLAASGAEFITRVSSMNANNSAAAVNAIPSSPPALSAEDSGILSAAPIPRRSNVNTNATMKAADGNGMSFDGEGAPRAASSSAASSSSPRTPSKQLPPPPSYAEAGGMALPSLMNTTTTTLRRPMPLRLFPAQQPQPANSEDAALPLYTSMPPSYSEARHTTSGFGSSSIRRAAMLMASSFDGSSAPTSPLEGSGRFRYDPYSPRGFAVVA